MVEHDATCENPSVEMSGEIFVGEFFLASADAVIDWARDPSVLDAVHAQERILELLYVLSSNPCL